MYRSYFTSEGMFGLTANISSTFVFMFIIFGAFLLKSGAGISLCALRTAGRADSSVVQAWSRSWVPG